MASQQNSGQLSFRARVPVFDANIGVGHCHDRPSPFADVAGLRAEMRRHGVERGLIYHLQGETLSAIEGNEALHAWLGDGTRPPMGRRTECGLVGTTARASRRRRGL